MASVSRVRPVLFVHPFDSFPGHRAIHIADIAPDRSELDGVGSLAHGHVLGADRDPVRIDGDAPREDLAPSDAEVVSPGDRIHYFPEEIVEIDV